MHISRYKDMKEINKNKQDLPNTTKIGVHKTFDSHKWNSSQTLTTNKYPFRQ